MITIEARAIRAPTQDSPDYTEATQSQIDLPAAIITKSGETIFDGAGVEQDITHHFITHYLAGLTFENWITHNGNRYKIVDVENIDERNEFYRIRATKRGSEQVAANYA